MLLVGSDDVNRINAQTRVIAVWTVGRCHAKYKCNGAWESHRVSVDEIEKQTGYNLLSNVQRVLEASADGVAL